MGGRPERRRRGPLGWLSALLGATILSSCFLLTPAQGTAISVTATPSNPLEAQDLTLTPGGKPDFVVCSWFRGTQDARNQIFTYIPLPPPEQQNGAGFTGRETAGPWCSLSIKHVRANDTANYIVTKTVRGGSEEGHVKVEVIALPSGGKRSVMEKGLMAAIVVGAWLLLC